MVFPGRCCLRLVPRAQHQGCEGRSKEVVDRAGRRFAAGVKPGRHRPYFSTRRGPLRVSPRAPSSSSSSPGPSSSSSSAVVVPASRPPPRLHPTSTRARPAARARVPASGHPRALFAGASPPACAWPARAAPERSRRRRSRARASSPAPCPAPSVVRAGSESPPARLAMNHSATRGARAQARVPRTQTSAALKARRAISAPRLGVRGVESPDDLHRRRRRWHRVASQPARAQRWRPNPPVCASSGGDERFSIRRRCSR